MSALSRSSVCKVTEGRPNIVDRIKAGDSDGHQHVVRRKECRRSYSIRRSSIDLGAVLTTVAELAAAHGIRALLRAGLVKSVQEYHKDLTVIPPAYEGQKSLVAHRCRR